MQENVVFQTIPTGSKLLDNMLGGGFLSYTINEIYGEAGSGKTILLHQIALICSYKLNSKVFFIDNDGTFRIENIIKIIKRLRLNDENSVKSILNRIIVAKTLSLNDFKDKLEIIAMLNEMIPLVIIDPITYYIRSLPRKEFENELKNIMFKIKQICDKGSCIIFSNQVTFKDNDKLKPVGNYLIEDFIHRRILLKKNNSIIQCIIELAENKIENRRGMFRITDVGFIGLKEKVSYYE
jgi:RecA/RadA recombinase